MRSRTPNLALVLALACWASNAHASESAVQLAYLDPGTGSLIFQVLAAAVAGAFVTMGGYWSKIKAFFGTTEAEDESDKERITPGDE